MYLLLSFTQVFAKQLQLLFCLYNYYYVSKLDKKSKFANLSLYSANTVKRS